MGAGNWIRNIGCAGWDSCYVKWGSEIGVFYYFLILLLFRRLFFNFFKKNVKLGCDTGRPCYSSLPAVIWPTVPRKGEDRECMLGNLTPVFSYLHSLPPIQDVGDEGRVIQETTACSENAVRLGDFRLVWDVIHSFEPRKLFIDVNEGDASEEATTIPPQQQQSTIHELSARLAHDFPLDRNSLQQKQQRALSTTNHYTELLDEKKVDHGPFLHVFIDNSNIAVGLAMNSKGRLPKLDYACLALILERGRHAARRVIVASSPLLQRIDVEGYEISVLQRVPLVYSNSDLRESNAKRKGRYANRTVLVEQGIDELLLLKMCESLLDYLPGKIVLATGDAAPSQLSSSGGFLACVKRALARGWEVEVASFDNSRSLSWTHPSLLEKWAGKLSIISLDPYIDALVAPG